MASEGGSSTAGVAVGVAAVGVAVAAGVAMAPKLGGESSPILTSSTAAAAFLNRATFGASDSSVAALTNTDAANWFTTQAAAGPTPGGAANYWKTTASFHLDWVTRRKADFDAAYQAAVAAAPAGQKVNRRRIQPAQFQESFWARAALGDDQLRHRMALALSEIFVVSFDGSTITPRIAASWYDMLSAHALGSYQDLLQAVTLHPAMGIYLNIVGNQQADNDPTRHPDENYGREVMQLMSIGLSQLAADGTVQLNASGAPIASYTHNDIVGLAATFTGWSWYAKVPNATTFNKQPADGTDASSSDVQPLIAYPTYHSQLAKTFLGTTVPAYTGAAPTTAAGMAALKAYQLQGLATAMATIAAHPNVGPFIGRRLIQRFVTSNPSPAYIGRVAAAFNGGAGNGGAGQARGDLLATIKAVLTDAEALDASGALAASPTYGRLREPVIRMSHWLRASAATSTATATAPFGNFQTSADFSDPSQLAQAPLTAPSVFNFWDPDFTPTGSNISKAGLVAPEFQGVDVLTVAGYANLMSQVIEAKGWPGGDVTTTYAAELAALSPTNGGADQDQALISRLNLIYFAGTMSTTMSSRLTRVLAGTAAANRNPTAAQLAQARLDKVRNALIIVLTSPEYLVQR